MVQRKAKIIAFTLVAFFSFGIWCTSLASLRSQILWGQHSGLQSGCMRTMLQFGRKACDPPKIACYSGFVLGPYFELARVSSRIHAFVKNDPIGHFQNLPVIVPNRTSLQSQQAAIHSKLISTAKVSVHLYNSVLILWFFLLNCLCWFGPISVSVAEDSFCLVTLCGGTMRQILAGYEV